MKNPLYITGISADGVYLVGGVWSLFHQEGFPIELAAVECRSRGVEVDWMEAMADASTSDNLPALVGHLEAFMSYEMLRALKVRFPVLLSALGSYEAILTNKRANAKTIEEIGFKSFGGVAL